MDVVNIVTKNGVSAVSLSELLGSKGVVLFFYPKDLTSACSKEAEDFNSFLSSFQEFGFQVVGVSTDSVKQHIAFIEKLHLDFPLIADIDKKLVQQFSVYVEKQMFNNKFFGIERSTFVLDKNLEILHSWRKVKVPEHVKVVLSYIKSL